MHNYINMAGANFIDSLLQQIFTKYLKESIVSLNNTDTPKAQGNSGTDTSIENKSAFVSTST